MGIIHLFNGSEELFLDYHVWIDALCIADLFGWKKEGSSVKYRSDPSIWQSVNSIYDESDSSTYDCVEDDWMPRSERDRLLQEK